MSGIDWMAVFFWPFALLTCLGAGLIVMTRNIVHAAAGLVLSLSSVAVLFFLAGAEFLGAMQLMIYVGGTVVLLAFGVMLTAQTTFLRLKTTADQWLMAFFLAALIAAVLLQAAISYGQGLGFGSGPLPLSEQGNSPHRLAESVTATQLGVALLGLPTESNADPSSQKPIGYLLPFELVSVHLLVVLVGAAYLARRTPPAPPRGDKTSPLAEKKTTNTPAESLN